MVLGLAGKSTTQAVIGSFATGVVIGAAGDDQVTASPGGVLLRTIWKTALGLQQSKTARQTSVHKYGRRVVVGTVAIEKLTSFLYRCAVQVVIGA